jgi:TM2 domain-containing membrane protein YozV
MELQPVIESKKLFWLALVFCFIGFFGIAGLHRLYTGKLGSGVIYLLTCGWFFIGTIIDLILIANGSWRCNDGTPLYK